jgi:hypothetical protein
MTEGTFQERMASEPMRCAYQVTYSMRMVSEIATNYNSAVDASQLLCASAMVDAFYVHIRLLAEFLVKGPEPRDIRPSNFGVSWSTPQSSEADRLKVHWDVASKYVVHFGLRRVPTNLDDLQPFEISGQAMTAMATDALIVAEEFVKLVEQSVTDVDSAGVKPARLMVAEHLRLAINQACQQIGLKS